MMTEHTGEGSQNNHKCSLPVKVYEIMKTNNSNKCRLHIMITLAIMIFIFVQSALPGHVSGAESGFFVSMLHELTHVDFDVLSLIVRKTAHFTEYMILGISLAVNVMDWRKSKGAGLSAFALWRTAWLIGTIYAVTDEIHQYFVPERACAVTDMLIDSAGVAVGVGIMMLIAYNKRVTSK